MKKQHPDDARTDALISTAVSYRVSFSRGRVDGEFVTVTEDAATLDEARATAQRLNDLYGKSGRRACIYAMLPNGKAEPMGERYGVQSAVYNRRDLGY